MLGSQHRILNTVAGIPPRYQDAIECGAHFFEVQYPKQSQFDQSIYGFYDIIVKKLDGLRPRFDKATKINATIKFEIVSKEGTLVAFIPDDMYWHNRIMLCDAQGYRITQMHTLETVIPASIVKMELDVLREFITEQVNVFKIIDEKNKEVDFFYDRKKADKFLLKNKEVELEIVEGTIPKKKKWIQEMIMQYKNAEYGWTSCIEFKEKIIPPVNAIIAEKKKAMVPDVAPQTMDPMQILAALKQLPPELLRSLVSVAQQQQPEEIAAPVAEQQKFTASGLDKKRLEELSRIAITLDISCEGKTKKELIEDIMNVTQKAVTQVRETAPELEEEMIVT